MHELDRILDRQDVAFEALVQHVDDGRQRGRLARTRLTGDQDHPAAVFAKVVDDTRHAEFLQRQRLRRDGTKNPAHAVQVAKYVDPEAADVFELIREIGAIALLQCFARVERHDLHQRRFGQGLRNRCFIENRQVAVDPNARRPAREEMQVGPFPL